MPLFSLYRSPRISETITSKIIPKLSTVKENLSKYHKIMSQKKFLTTGVLTFSTSFPLFTRPKRSTLIGCHLRLGKSNLFADTLNSTIALCTKLVVTARW